EGDPAAGIDSLAAARKAAQAEAEAARKQVKDAQAKAEVASQQAKLHETHAAEMANNRKEAENKLALADEQLRKTKARADEMAAQLTALATKLDTKPADVAKKVEALLSLVKNQDPKGEVAALLKEVSRYKALVSQMRPPQELLNVWLQLDLGRKLDLWALGL